MIKQLQLNRNHIKIERALISVFDKTGVVELAKTLEEMNVEILSTGGTYKVLQEASIKVVDVSEYTKFPEIMNGRVKTINPLIGGGLLGLRDEHENDAKEKNNIAGANQAIVDALYALALQAQKAVEENKPLLETNSFNF